MPKILALETSGAHGSVAVCDGATCIAEADLNQQQRTAQSLAPTIQSLLREVGWRPAELELIAVTQGPGSFTGLRVGVTTAKVLAYACGAEVLGVNTLEVLASQVEPRHEAVWTVLDAERGQLFAALFDTTCEPFPQLRSGVHILDASTWLGHLTSPATVTGWGLKSLLAQLPPHALAAPEQLWQPRASSVAALAFHRHRQGERGDLWSLVPDYHRPSAAEEKRRLVTQAGLMLPPSDS